MQDKINTIARGRTGKNLLELLDLIKKEIADIRTPLKIRKEIENEVRLGIIEAIDIFLVDKIRVSMGEVTPPNEDEYN